MKWEYLIRSWAFVGPERDDWPGREVYAAGIEQQLEAASSGGSLVFPVELLVGNVDVFKGEEGDQLRRAYLQWCIDTEQDYLNEYGAAGFELVSMNREVRRLDRHHFPVIQAHAYLKREAAPGAPPPPQRRIGFLTTDVG